MKRSILTLILVILIGFGSVGKVYSYWIWTPKTKKWVNPKYAPKPTPQEQLVYASEFYNADEYKEAEREFKSLLKAYPKSKEAAEAQYYLGMVYEKQNKLYAAYLAYQKVIDVYPFSERIQEIISREFKIAEAFMSGEKRKFVGVPLPVENPAIEIFQRIIDNSEYGPLAPIAQYKLGLVLKGLGRFFEAEEAFEKVVYKYPNSEWVDAAKFQIASARADQSQGPDYDQEAMQDAKQKFEEFVREHPDAQLSREAEKNILELRLKEAESNFNIAAFYEKQKVYKSAKIYYEIVVRDYPESPLVAEAAAKIKEFEESGLDKISDPKELKQLEKEKRKAEKKAKREAKLEAKRVAREEKLKKAKQAKQEKLEKKQRKIAEAKTKREEKIQKAKAKREEKLKKAQEAKQKKLEAKQKRIAEAKAKKEEKLKKAREARQKKLEAKQKRIAEAKAKKEEKIQKAKAAREEKLKKAKQAKEKRATEKLTKIEQKKAAREEKIKEAKETRQKKIEEKKRLKQEKIQKAKAKREEKLKKAKDAGESKMQEKQEAEEVKLEQKESQGKTPEASSEVKQDSISPPIEEGVGISSEQSSATETIEKDVFITEISTDIPSDVTGNVTDNATQDITVNITSEVE